MNVNLLSDNIVRQATVLVVGSLLGAFVVVVGLSQGCGKATSPAPGGDTSPAPGGETNWLRRCSATDPNWHSVCGRDLQCLCGVCTSACADDTSCGELNANARCAFGSTTPYAEACESRTLERVCVRAVDAPVEVQPEPLDCPAGQVETPQGCQSCDDARAALDQAVSDLPERQLFNRCNVDRDCAYIQWDSSCDYQCPVAVTGNLYQEAGVALYSLSQDHCRDPAEWRATCGEQSSDCGFYVTPICRGGRCIIVSDALRCSERSMDDCDRDGDCQRLPAFNFDVERQCFSREAFYAGCADADELCIPQPFVASDGLSCFLAGDCLPRGGSPAPLGHPCLSASGTCDE